MSFSFRTPPICVTEDLNCPFLPESCTLMIPWQVASGSPTRLVLLMDMIWSPMLSLPERAAGPPFIILAKITVGRMEPQPDSTITTPRISPLLFSSCSYGEESRRGVKKEGRRVCLFPCGWQKLWLWWKTGFLNRKSGIPFIKSQTFVIKLQDSYYPAVITEFGFSMCHLIGFYRMDRGIKF